MVLREGQSDSDVGGWEVMVVKVKAEKQRALSDTLLETILRNLIKQIKYKKSNTNKTCKRKIRKKKSKIQELWKLYEIWSFLHKEPLFKRIHAKNVYCLRQICMVLASHYATDFSQSLMLFFLSYKV